MTTAKFELIYGKIKEQLLNEMKSKEIGSVK